MESFGPHPKGVLVLLHVARNIKFPKEQRRLITYGPNNFLKLIYILLFFLTLERFFIQLRKITFHISDTTKFATADYSNRPFSTNCSTFIAFQKHLIKIIKILLVLISVWKFWNSSFFTKSLLDMFKILSSTFAS